MLNYQCIKIDEYSDSQRINALNHYRIDYSLFIDHCSLIIEPTAGGV